MLHKVGNLQKKLCLVFIAITVVSAVREESTAELFRDLDKIVQERDEMRELFDVDDFNIQQTINNVFDEHGIDGSFLMKDWSRLTGLWGIFKGGDTKTAFATYNFAFQISCFQGKDHGVIKTGLYAENKYNDYGCYCGGGLSYGTALDETDRCCLAHDKCYVAARGKFDLNLHCDVYTVPYTVTCCRKEKDTKCDNKSGSVGRTLCECDQAMSKCVATSRALNSYRSSLKGARKRCRVPGKTTTSPNIFRLITSCKNIRKRTSSSGTGSGQGSCKTLTKKESGRWT